VVVAVALNLLLELHQAELVVAVLVEMQVLLFKQLMEQSI
jgi:hypothetical protein